MNKKEFTDYEELRKFVEPMIAEQKWAIDVRQNTETGVYMALWIEHKNVERDGGVKEPDEIWTTRMGEMICVQDMSEKHVRNVLRMILRSEREQCMLLETLMKQMAGEQDLTPNPAVVSPPKQTLH
jgi:hypothetical protein